MSKKVTITWEVNDGYAGASRPQYTEIPVEDFEGLDDEGITGLIYDAVQTEFENSIDWDIEKSEEDLVAMVKEAREGAE